MDVKELARILARETGQAYSGGVTAASTKAAEETVEQIINTVVKVASVDPAVAARKQAARDRAVSLALHYIKMGGTKGGEWGSDNDAEVTELVDLIIVAAEE